MKKLLLFIIAMFIFTGCEPSTSTKKVSVETPPDVTDNIEPDPNVNNITTLVAAGTVTVPTYTANSFDGVMYNTSSNKTITLSTTGTPLPNSYNKVTVPKNNVEGRDSFHKSLRDKEQELLSTGREQNGSNIYSRKAPSIVAIGDKWENIKVYADISVSIIDADCVAISQYANFYVEDNFLPITAEATALLEEYKSEFDKMYLTMHDKFDTENDTDGNRKVNILFADMKDPGLSGYFDSTDKYPVTEEPDSNESDVLYLNYMNLAEKGDALATMAHEFQHMILFDYKYNKGYSTPDLWLNEGLSMQAEYIAGYDELQRSNYVEGFFEEYHNLSLTNWDGIAANYGYSMIYIRYLAEQFPNVIKDIYNSSYINGIYAVEAATDKGFNDIFKNFVFTLFVAGRGITDDPKYNIMSLSDNESFHITHQAGLDAGSSKSRVLRPYSMNFIKFNGKVDSITLSEGGEGFIITE